MIGSKTNDIVINMGRIGSNTRRVRTVMELQLDRIFVRTRSLESVLICGYSAFYHLGKFSLSHQRAAIDMLKAKERMTLILWKKRGLKLKKSPKPTRSVIGH